MEMNVYGITTLAGASGPATGERISLYATPCKLPGKRAPLANSRAGGNRHVDGWSAAPVLRRIQPAHAGLHKVGRHPRHAGWLHLLYGECRAALLAARHCGEL